MTVYVREKASSVILIAPPRDFWRACAAEPDPELGFDEKSEVMLVKKDILEGT